MIVEVDFTDHVGSRNKKPQSARIRRRFLYHGISFPLLSGRNDHTIIDVETQTDSSTARVCWLAHVFLHHCDPLPGLESDQ